MKHINRFASVAVAFFLTGTLAAQTSLHPRWVPPKKELTEVPVWLDDSRIIFKVAENEATNAADYHIYDDAALWAKVTGIFGQADYDIAPLFFTPKDKILARRQKAQELSGKQLSNLTLYYQVTFENTSPGQRLSFHNAIMMLNEVETAYFPLLLDYSEEAKKPAGISMRASPDFTATQAYLKPAPVGIDAMYGWLFAGGMGDSITFCDVERDGYRDHEEFLTPPIVDVSILTGYSWGNQHGTAVFGEVISDHDGSGVDGIAPDVTPIFSTICGDVNCSFYNQAGGIDQATQNMEAGDVMLLEVQTVSPSPFGAPIEYEQASFDAIEIATSLGIIVVEAAGNGSNNLDQGVFAPLFDTTNRYSGAYIIGAANMDSSIVGATWPPRQKKGFSSYGARVDFYAYGEMVTTTGYGDLWGSGNNDYYTATFSGTSSASPIVAGACCIMQGIYKEQTGNVLPPWRLRDIFKQTGTPSYDPPTDLIGVMPNLKRAIDTLLVIITSEREAIGLPTEEVTIYPNPGHHLFYLDAWLSEGSDAQVSVTDMMGRPVISRKVTVSGVSLHETLDMSGQPAGIYMVKLHTENKQFIKKIIKN